MYYIVSSMSFPIYMLVTIGVFVLSIYSIYDMRKKKPGHPMIWALPFAMIADAALIVYRCSIELTTNLYFQKIANVCVIISMILFVISFVVTFIIADKKNYTAQGKKARRAKSTLIECAIVAVIGIILIIVGYLMKENKLF